MDISKLPRMSETPPPPPPQPDDKTTPPAAHPGASAYDSINAGAGAGGLAEAWISLAIGVILLLMTPNTLQYASSKMFGTKFEPFADPTRPFPAKCDFVLYTDGTKVFYRDMQVFWSDLAITAFALVLIIDGLILLRTRHNWKALMVAFGFTVAATAVNLFYLIATFQSGLALISALAVIFGVYIAIHQWRLIAMMRFLERGRSSAAA